MYAKAIKSLVLLAVLAGARTAAAQRPSADHDVTGIWTYSQQDYDHPPEMPLTPEGARIQAAKVKAVEEDLQVLPEAGKRCLPEGMPGMMANEFALELLESPGRVTLLNEANTMPRTIYLNRTRRSEGGEPMWNGYSVGRWEGATLVVTTTDMNDRIGPFAYGGGVHSSTTTLTERIHLGRDRTELVDEMTFVDPRFLARPWTVVRHYTRQPEDAELWEYACEVGAAGWSERYSGEKNETAPPGR